MLLPYHVVLPNGHETILLLTKKHQERDFPDAVLVGEEPTGQEEALETEATLGTEAAAQEEKPKSPRRTRKTTS